MKTAFIGLAMMLAMTLGAGAPAYAGKHVEPITVDVDIHFHADRLTPETAAILLEPSIGRLKAGSREVCTVWKMGEMQWATAWHCVALPGKKYEIKTQATTERKYYDYGLKLEAKSLLLPAEKADEKDHWEDWAVINVKDESPDVPVLEIQCKYPIALGEQLAYMGFPTVTQGMAQHFSVGIVNAIEKHKKRTYHFTAQLTGGPGASGSPVISMKTGKVIGMVTRGVSSRGTLLSVGMESVDGMDFCDDEVGEGVVASPGKGGLYGSF